ncbi:MAG: helix-turn-helix domain-containing protein [Pontibacterium sp.]
MNDDFSQNLRLLTSYYKSVSDVCRRLNINRPQFNRYLNGRSMPSANTMRRFCDFFGVEDYEMRLPHDQFRRLVQVRPRPDVTQDSQPNCYQARLQTLLKAGNQGLEKYLGYYFEYYQSMACPGKILRTLVCLEIQDNHVVFQRTERFDEARGTKVCHAVYLGMAMLLTDRLFLVDYESLTGNELTQTILFPSYKNRVNRLTGIKTGVSGSGERMPCSARVVYEFLGESVNVRQALKLCGLYDQDSQEIDSSLVSAINNQVEDGEWHFRARPI